MNPTHWGESSREEYMSGTRFLAMRVLSVTSMVAMLLAGGVVLAQEAPPAPADPTAPIRAALRMSKYRDALGLARQLVAERPKYSAILKSVDEGLKLADAGKTVEAADAFAAAEEALLKGGGLDDLDQLFLSHLAWIELKWDVPLEKALTEAGIKDPPKSPETKEDASALARKAEQLLKKGFSREAAVYYESAARFHASEYRSLNGFKEDDRPDPHGKRKADPGMGVEAAKLHILAAGALATRAAHRMAALSALAGVAKEMPLIAPLEGGEEVKRLLEQARVAFGPLAEAEITAAYTGLQLAWAFALLEGKPDAPDYGLAMLAVDCGLQAIQWYAGMSAVCKATGGECSQNKDLVEGCAAQAIGALPAARAAGDRIARYSKDTSYEGLMKALDLADKALAELHEIVPKDADAYVRHADVAFRTTERKWAHLSNVQSLAAGAALLWLDKAVAAAPDKAVHYYMRGTMYSKKEAKREAIADFKKFLELAPADDPHVPEVRKLLEGK